MKNVLKVVPKEEIKIYWSKAEAETAEGSWGNEQYFNELEKILLYSRGRVHDLSCGTSETIETFSKFQYVQIKGFDLRYDRPYSGDPFKYFYCVGQLEYLTDKWVDTFLKRIRLHTKHISFFLVPVSEENTIEMWTPKFSEYFKKVYVINSVWEDPGKSVGKWFICINKKQN